MDVLVLADDRSRVGRRLLKQIRSVVPKERMEVCRTFKELYQCLQRAQDKLKAVLLLAETRTRLWQLRYLGLLPEQLPLILVLPERTREVIQAGFSLRPCFSTYVDSAFHEVAQVLNHILAQPLGNVQRKVTVTFSSPE